MDDEKKTIVSLFAHPDDELGAIGTLANHAERGDNVILLFTTYGELTTLFPEFTHEEIKQERTKHGQEIARIVGGKSEFMDLGDSHVDISREHRIEVAKMYVKHRPDLVVTWGSYSSNHPDHRNTGQLAVDAIKFARINSIMNTEEPHRKNIVLLQYFEKHSGHRLKYIDVSDTMGQVRDAVNFYADIYKWEHAQDWAIDSRRAYGRESNTKYAEKFNLRFNLSKPSKYAI